jgi:glycosyltransferase involved in cell wall biosynthesis
MPRALVADRMKRLVSILIPAFNAEAWIADTIKSALDQTWSQKEIVIVDDGSTDQTLSIARRFAAKGVTVVSQTNQGAASARNKAFSVCHGDYIQWLDADDLLSPEKIAKQMEALEHRQSRRTLFSSAWGWFLYRPWKARFNPTALWHDLTPVEWMLRKMEHGVFMQTSVWLVSRELTEAAGPWNTRLLGDDDGEYFSRVVLASDGIRFIPEARVFYRRRLDGLGFIGNSKKKLEANFLSTQLQIGYLRSVADTQRARLACRKYLQTDLPYYYPSRPDLIKQSEDLAATLGCQLEPPQMPWKYAWIGKLFGWTAARQTQLSYNQCKFSVLKSWDRFLFRVENRQQSMSKVPKRFWGILTRRERWGLSRRGCLILMLAMLLAGGLLGLKIHSFLAVTQRVDANVLVVEGWVHEYAILAGVKEFEAGHYPWVYTTGGPVTGSGGYTTDYNTGANVGAWLLRKAGVPADSVQMVPSHVMGRDRTYYSAAALRDWFREQKITVHSLNVVTENTHARRTRLLFQEAFGKGVKIGIIAVPNPDYDARYWWRYSDGVREVLNEAIAYLYVRLFFHPSAPTAS